MMKLFRYFCPLALILTLSACDNAPPEAEEPIQSPWAAIAKGYVSIEGGIIGIDAPRPGIIRQVLVEEGDRVKQGDLLASIENKEARQALVLAKNQHQEAVLDHQLTGQRLIIARREYQRLAGLNTATLAAQQRDTARDQVTLLEAELAMKAAVVDTASARIAVAELEVDRHQVRAPVDGQIVKRNAKPGEGASTLNVTRLFMLAPDSPRIIRAELEDAFVNAVRPGQKAEVIMENDDQHTYRATVLRLGQVFGARAENDDPAVKKDARVIGFVLTLDDAPNVRLGQRVLVRVPNGQTNKLQHKH